MPSLTQIRKDISCLPTSFPLVIAIFGGTTGIGSYVARSFARLFSQHGANLRVYLVGRNASRAEEILAYAKKTAPESDWTFVEVGNAALMSECERVAGVIKEREERQPFEDGTGGKRARLDAVYLSWALSPVVNSPLTPEGLDTQMSLLYYSRIKLTLLLTPLLQASVDPTAHVISIFAGSMEDSNKPASPPIGTPAPEKYGVTSVRNHVTFMKTFMFEKLAEENRGKIAYTHIYPGLVDGLTFYNVEQPLWFRIAWRVLKPLMSWYMTGPEDCGDVMVGLVGGRYPAKGVVGNGYGDSGEDVMNSTLMERGGGCYGVGQRGDANKDVAYKMFRGRKLEGEVWEHTMGVLEGIQGKNTSLAK